MLLEETKDFNGLIDNKPFFDQQVQNKEKAFEKCQKIILTQEEIY